MSDLFFNKIAAAGLAAALGFIAINKIANIAVHADIPSTPAYSVYVADASDTVVEVEAPFPQADWIDGIDAVKGAKVFKKCTSCHNAVEGGKNGTGPALWNVVGRAAGTGADFDYSPAMGSSGITWTYEELDNYLASPKTYIPKNKMNFIGVKKASDRAAVIEYLRLASNTPIAALTEAAPIPGAGDSEVGHLDEAHVEDAAHETAPDGTVEHEMAPMEKAPAEMVPAETMPVETVPEAAVSVPDVPAAVEEIVEEVIDTPAPEILEVPSVPTIETPSIEAPAAEVLETPAAELPNLEVPKIDAVEQTIPEIMVKDPIETPTVETPSVATIDTPNIEDKVEDMAKDMIEEKIEETVTEPVVPTPPDGGQ